MKLLLGSKTDYDDLIISNNRCWSARLYYESDDKWRPVSNDTLQSMTINDYVCDGTNITMGCVAGSKATVSLVGIDTSTSAALSEGVKIRVQLNLSEAIVSTLLTPDTVTLVTPVWVITECKRQKLGGGKYDCTLTAYDISYIMTKSYVQSGKLTALQAVTSIANKYGLTVNSSVGEAVSATDGSTPHLFEPLDEEITDKQMLAYLAGYYGCYAEINENREICFSWFTLSDDVIGSDRVFDGGAYVTEMEERTIVLLESGTSDTPLVAPSDANGFSINFENPYMTAEQLNAVYDARIAGGAVSFRIGKVHYKGSPLNNPGTIVTVEDIDGDTAVFYIMKRTLEYDGGLSETIECLGESESAIAHGNTSPLQKKINRTLSRMENAIKNATDVITQTKGSIFELIPVDENDPTKGNSGWKLYSTEIGSNNVILANSSGIGFSSNGGQSFNAAAIYIDENGTGHINADFIDVGQISADMIDTTELVISQGNVDGLEDILSEIDEKADTATATADNANTTADNAKTTAVNASNKATSALSAASSAQSTANSVNTVIGQWCYENNTTYIDGGRIYTGSITADKIAANSITADKLAAGAITAESVNVGWQSGNCAANWYNPNGLNLDDYFTVTAESSDKYYAKVLLKKAYSGTIRCSSKPFYVSNGDTINFGGTIKNATAKQSGLYLEYSSKSDGSYSVKEYAASSSTTAGSYTRSYKATASGWYRLTCAFDSPASGSYHSGVYCMRSVRGDMIVNGTIKSTDGLTYFDLDKSALVSENSSGYKTKLTSAGVVSSYSTTDAENNYVTNNAGGMRAVAMDGTTQPSLWLWFKNSLRISLSDSSSYTTDDQYLGFGTEGITTYKMLNITDADIKRCKNIQTGIATDVTSSGKTVYFSRSFLNKPRVVCTALQANAENSVGVAVTVTNVSTTGFTMRTNVASGSWSYGSDVNWIAIDI